MASISEREHDRDSIKLDSLTVENVSCEDSTMQPFRLYKMRFYALLLLICMNIACALNWLLFTAISYDTAAHFGISTTQVSWLANAVCAMYIIVAPVVPALVARFGLAGVLRLAATGLILGTWLRYAAIALISSDGQFALLMVGSFCVGFAQCIAQVVVPLMSETWFNASNRTTATMLCAVANPLGGAVASLIAPGSSISVLLLATAVASTVVALSTALLPQRPPTPPSASAQSRLDLSFGSSFLRLRLLQTRDRIDLAELAFVFTIVMAFFDAYLTLTNIIFEPVGYTSDQAGYIGAAVIGSGLVCAIITAPILDRQLKNHIVIVAKVLVPLIGASFLALIWATRPNQLGALLAISVIMGGASFTLLPIALELAAELTFQAGLGPEWSASVLYWGANGLSVVTVVSMTALQDSEPPFSMHKALIYQGVFVFVSCLLIWGIRGKQYRKEHDESRKQGGAQV